MNMFGGSGRISNSGKFRTSFPLGTSASMEDVPVQRELRRRSEGGNVDEEKVAATHRYAHFVHFWFFASCGCLRNLPFFLGQHMSAIFLIVSFFANYFYSQHKTHNHRHSTGSALFNLSSVEKTRSHSSDNGSNGDTTSAQGNGVGVNTEYKSGFHSEGHTPTKPPLNPR